MSKKRHGFTTLEFLLNLLVYLPIFLLLFQISIIPLQQFYLSQSARSAALVYIQIKHYEGNTGNIKDIISKMIPELDNQDETHEEIEKKDAKEIAKYYIKNQFVESEKKNALPGKIFNPNKIEVKIADTGEVSNDGNIFRQVASKIGKAFSNLFSTQEVSITVSYPFTLFKVFDLSFGTFKIEYTYSIRYNP